MLGGLLAAMLVASYLPAMSRELFEGATNVQALVASAVVICLVGVADDIWSLSALMKFAGQLVAAGLVVGGIRLVSLPLPSGTYPVLRRGPGHVADDRARRRGGERRELRRRARRPGRGRRRDRCRGILQLRVLAVEGNFSRLTTPALVTAVLCGMCLGFLPHNVHPARVFMGDSGSMLIGLMLAAASISLTGSFPVQDDGVTLLPALLPLFLPLA